MGRTACTAPGREEKGIDGVGGPYLGVQGEARPALDRAEPNPRRGPAECHLKSAAALPALTGAAKQPDAFQPVPGPVSDFTIDIRRFEQYPHHPLNALLRGDLFRALLVHQSGPLTNAVRVLSDQPAPPA